MASMKRVMLLVALAAMLAASMALAGVAWADDVFCSSAAGERCEGSELSDDILGTPDRDQIFALGGFDQVVALSGQDELHGNNGGDGLFGGNNRDAYFGGNGSDFLSENEGSEVTTSGPDEMNGGPGEDYMEGNNGADILRGQDGDECGGFFDEGEADTQMFGDAGNDQLYGGAGEDCMEGEEGADEHHGGPDNDFIDAIDNDNDPETGAPLGTEDVVDCGGGVDIAVVNSDEDDVLDNCENVIDVASATTRVAAPSGTTDEEQRRQGKAFLQQHGG
jgi:Ca2+-binding RTX toxin-like protein